MLVACIDLEIQTQNYRPQVHVHLILTSLISGPIKADGIWDTTRYMYLNNLIIIPIALFVYTKLLVNYMHAWNV